MERSADALQTRVLEVEEISTDVDAQATHTTPVVADHRVRVAAEDGQELPDTCAPSPELPTSVAGAPLHIRVESTAKGHADVSRGESEPGKPNATTAGVQKQPEICERVREKEATSQSQRLCSEEDQSLNVITVSKVVEVDKEAALESNRNVVDVDEFDAAARQYPITVDKFELGDHSGGQTRNARESVKETIREIHNNDSSQNSSIVMDAELSKLVQEEEAVVVVVETIPVITDATANDYIVTVDEKDSGKECDHGTAVGLQEKSDQGDNEIELLDYSQENDGTIIEVTEIIDAPIVEECEQRDNEDCTESEKHDAAAVKIIDGKIAIDKDKKIVITENDGLEATRDAPEIGDTRENTVREAVDDSERETTPTRDSSATDPSTKKRSVIQDIFDDWGVENTDEDVQSPSKVHDSVEIELKSLLDETKSDQTVKIESFAAIRDEVSSRNVDRVADEDATGKKDAAKQSTERAENQKTKKPTDRETGSAVKSEKNSPGHPVAGKSSRGAETRALNSTPQSHAISKNHSRHLTSQIASPAEVTEVLKQRLREKQKTVVDAPRGPDIFFVKKLTQRLSSRLAGNPKNPVSGLAGSQQATPPAHSSSSSLSSASVQPTADNCDKKTTETSKGGSSDNKELLAILEGDVDPDWSVLNPPALTEEAKSPSSNVEPAHSGPPKLDPLLERELALKQLLELPVKKTPLRKRKTFQPAPGKAKDAVTKSSLDTQSKEEIVNVDVLGSEEAPANPESAEARLCSTPPRKHTEDRNDRMAELVVMRAEESRSGRKRKPTEKAREHEQNTMKRQKVYRGKVSMDKRQEGNLEGSAMVKMVVMKNEVKTDDANNVTTTKKEATDKELEDRTDPSANQVDSFLVERSKQNLVKKGPIAKRKVMVKRLLRQKMPTNAKPVQLKTKLSASKKSASKVIAKPQKRTSEGASGDAKPKKKSINEIDKLLQDEGVVNLLYDVEQPTKKRLVPITKSRAKVMDLQKVQRELKIRKKLVRNAVLRLRTSTTAGVTKVSPRSKRTAVQPADVQLDRKVGEQAVSPKTPNSATSPTEFILPAKIRNAADASIIVRRHSSSSFSSASGSPRVSVDSPAERPFADTGKPDDGTAHSLRSAKKRRNSQDEKMNNAKRTKKRRSDTDDGTGNADTINTLEIGTATSDTVTSDVEEKVTVAARPGKKSDVKKLDKTVKQENVSTLEDNVSSKVTTRSSNGAVTPGKVTAKSRRAVKSKVTFARANDPDNAEESSKEEDELSVCLAEAATALSVVSARSGNVTVTRKSKANASTAKTDLDSKKAKTEAQNQFSNKEINVRRHGNLVQLILTPSSSTKVRNALTLQVMQEFREALSILKRDDECRVVLLTSTGTSFCEGLDLSMLLHANKEERRSVAQELAHAVKDFIKSLATFNKPIVAGVQGAAIGLGVTMLPLFDLVIASDKATFCTPYGKLGQIAEGAAVFTLSHILGSAITSELLLSGRTLTASEALRAGLVTRVLWPDRFQVELLPSLRAMGDQSSQSMEATKALLRHSLRKKLDAALESETYLLIQHWCSTECQTAIKAYIDGKIQ
ncbi:uncharacterized protein LOC105281562 isoform X2 [Ooceraea biroi]|uniref:uncharacterized protein LOC105281562 isoform X2 n=1 Tax=Ooceraea biroi TaxID=2015173 RepID=UPI000F076A4C|nr:uncharacterized protein LOC105281562 isoform X2 [Ooceraea biroi]